jgi:hypothetical protein
MRLVSIVVAVALALPACTFNFNTPAPDPDKVAPTEREASPALPDAASESALADRFFDAGWRYCDAVVLTGVWGGDTWEAKVRAGRQLSDGGTADVKRAVEDARKAARDGRGRPCAFHETGYGYDDAAALAQAWGSSIEEAKSRVTSKVLWGDYDLIDTMIRDASHGGGPANTGLDPDERAMRAFFDSPDLDYCHAKMLSAAWSSTVSQAKVILGHKVLGGYTQNLAAALEEARTHAQQHAEARCSWVETGFTYSDAEQIAQLWDMSVDEAKAALTEKYLYGSESNARSILAAHRTGD